MKKKHGGRTARFSHENARRPVKLELESHILYFVWQACLEMTEKVLWILSKGYSAGDKTQSEKTAWGLLHTRQSLKLVFAEHSFAKHRFLELYV